MVFWEETTINLTLHSKKERNESLSSIRRKKELNKIEKNHETTFILHYFFKLLYHHRLTHFFQLDSLFLLKHQKNCWHLCQFHPQNEQRFSVSNITVFSQKKTKKSKFFSLFNINQTKFKFFTKKEELPKEKKEKKHQQRPERVVCCDTPPDLPITNCEDVEGQRVQNTRLSTTLSYLKINQGHQPNLVKNLLSLDAICFFWEDQTYEQINKLTLRNIHPHRIFDLKHYYCYYYVRK